MVVYYAIVFFVFGLMFGSFYNVVGYRLPKKESLAFPSSHCPVCNHKLSPLELIPVISFLCLGGKCKACKTKISWYYAFFELLTGLLFMLSYLRFGLSAECLAAVVFSSILVIIIISDYKYYIIPDEIIIIGAFLLVVTIFVSSGYATSNFDLTSAFKGAGIAILNGVISFCIMYGIKLLGDYFFKRESMGGGDIKLLFLFGLVIGFQLSIISIFLASFIGLPVSIFLMKKKRTQIIPFGPFLAISALILYFSGIDWMGVLSIFV